MMRHAMNKMIRPRGTATYQDVIDAPPNVTAEIIYGALHTHPRPAPKHAVSHSSLGAELHGPFSKGSGGPGGWWILDEPEVHLGTDVLAPDVAGWRRERMPTIPDTAWFDIVPDWVCEIHSPSTRKVDQIDKSEIYATFGVKHMWFVDPDERTLIAYENNDGAWTTIATLRDDDPVCVAPFDAITFKLDDLWA
ncbi:Uma2 family endonuclease [Tateyamaria sp. syn59]|uniref:Uma2 family endonuclease n=1 Tax=Tateyamaria sp. syn59 TaxID=2576942 RepID=UPI001CB92E55|nr:Uma2 family endonuclease [Tateyamaria sp. syn59]